MEKKPKKETKKTRDFQDTYTTDIRNFVGKIVEVEKLTGDKIRGKCLSINFNHLNVVLEVNGNIVIIKNIQSITRNA